MTTLPLLSSILIVILISISVLGTFRFLRTTSGAAIGWLLELLGDVHMSGLGGHVGAGDGHCAVGDLRALALLTTKKKYEKIRQ